MNWTYPIGAMVWFFVRLVLQMPDGYPLFADVFIIPDSMATLIFIVGVFATVKEFLPSV